MSFEGYNNNIEHLTELFGEKGAKSIYDKYGDKIYKMPIFNTNAPYGFLLGDADRIITTADLLPNTTHYAGSSNYGARYTIPQVNVAGHTVKTVKTKQGDTLVNGADIWKFYPSDYSKKWTSGTPISKAGLGFIDEIGIPIITTAKPVVLPNIVLPKKNIPYEKMIDDITKSSIISIFDKKDITVSRRFNNRFLDYIPRTFIR